jgi:hypothetical protein
MLRTSGVNLRRGISDDRPARNFAAFPSWDGDTLQFAPLPIEAFGAQDPAVLRQFPRTVASAVLHQRELFRDIATGWAASDPRSADAAEAVAISLMLLGEVSAIDTLSHARRLATTATERQRVMAAEVFLRLQVGAPGNLKEVQRAKSVADSLLTDTSKSAADPHMLASIAALTGRAFRTLAIERAIPAKYWEPSTALVRGNSTQLTLLAAFGGPRDSLRLIERRIDSLIHALVPQPRQQATRSDALSRAVTMAFPAERLSSLHEISRPQSSLLFAEASLAGGDTDATRAVLGKIQDSRSAFALPEVTMDAVFPEAYLIDATGNPELASRWLDSRLSRLSVASSLVEPIQAAMLVRAMAFRAELAHRMGDQATAARWAGVVAALWADADPFLQPVVIRMQELLQAGKSGRTTSRSSTIP